MAKPLSFRQRLALLVLPPLVAGLVRLLALSWRVRLSVPEASHPRRGELPLIYAFWHQSVLTVTAQWRGEAIQGMASQSFDGGLIAETMHYLGYPPLARGSSSRGGAEALAFHLQGLSKGLSVVVTPDGPRGPAKEAKRGVLQMATRSGRPVVATACHCSSRWRLRSWDGTQVPPPFAKVAFALSEPIALGNLSEDQALLRLQAELLTIEQRAQELWDR